MVSVTARKIRNHGRERASLGVGRTYAGYLISYPSVGRGMVIFRDPNGHRMVTTPVRRVLGDAGGDQIYVETENSVYLLTFRAEPLREMPHALAAVTQQPTAQGLSDRLIRALARADRAHPPIAHRACFAAYLMTTGDRARKLPRAAWSRAR